MIIRRIETISHYRVLELLGQGGMGEVYLVEDLRLHRKAALKLISAELTRHEERRARFVQEATLAASIDHPHIAAIYDIDQADGRTFIVMEYVEGQSLRALLRTAPLKPRRAIELAMQIADALAKVHERGVVHRDLKPDNVLVATGGYAKVIDFGIAKLADPLRQPGLAGAATMTGVKTESGQVLGTTSYMSPEQARGEVVDARSDIFSFGVLLQEMLTRVPPFQRGSAAETLSAILNDVPAPVAMATNAGSDLQRILTKCLAKDQGSRYQTMRDLVVDLRALHDVMGSGSTMGQAAAAPSSRRRSIGVAALVVAALVLAAGGWLVYRNRPAPIAAVSESARPAIAVLAFEVVSATSQMAWLGNGLPSMLVTGLAQTADFEVIGTQRLSDAARQMGAGSLDAVERSQLSELARRAGAHFVVTGTLAQSGEDLRIDARVEDLTSGGIRFAQSVRGRDVFALADDLSARIRAGFNVEPSPGVRKVADVASGSVEAYRAYSDGVEAFYNARFDAAAKLFESATRIDPGFAMAHYQLAVLAEFRFRDTLRDDVLAAAKHVDRLPEREALLIRAQLARSESRFDEADRLLESVIAKYPDTESAYLSLGLMHMPLLGSVPNVERTVSAFQRGVEALPYSPGLRNSLGYALMTAGRFDAAVTEFQVYVKLRPNEPNTLDSLAEALLVRGDVDQAVETYGRALAAGHAGARTGRALANAVRGRHPEALADLPDPSFTRSALLSRMGRYRAADLAARREANAGDPERLVSFVLLDALLHLERGDCTRAQRDIDAARQTVAGFEEWRRSRWLVFGALISGTCDARAGRVDQARGLLSAAKAMHKTGAENERWWIAVLEGEMALAANDVAAATKAFTSAEPPVKMVFARTGSAVPLGFFANNLILRDGRARAAIAAGRNDEAIAIYRGLLTPGRANKWTAMLDPRHVLALARVLDKAGRKAEAHAEYQRFLALWKEADAELPELAEARRALAR